MTGDNTQPGWRSALGAAPAIGFALLPNVTCPACWPVYAGVLSSLGVPVLMNNAVLLPLTVLFMAVAVGALGYRAQRRGGYGALGVGVVAAVMVIGGKFLFATDGLVYAGMVLLVAASLWNSRPRRSRASRPCPACSDPGELVQLQRPD